MFPLPLLLLEPFAAGTVPVFVALALGLFAVSTYLFFAYRPGAWSDSRWLLAAAILLRLALIPVEPVLGRDVYRYLFEGRVQLFGFNPYIQPPADPALAELRDEYYERIDHPEIPTIYPPLAQLVFRLSAYAGDSPRIRLVLLKSLFVAFDIGILLLLFALSRSRSSSVPAGSVRWSFYAFHPAPLLEVGWNAHVDVLAVFFLTLALFFYFRENASGPASAGGRRFAVGVGASLVGGVWSKILPGLAAPFLLRLSWASFLGLALGGVAALVMCVPFFDPAMLTGLKFFSEFWAFNSPLFTTVAFFQNGRPADVVWRAGSLVLFAGVLLFQLSRFWKSDRSDPAPSLAWVFLWLLIFSPVVHPWYALMLLPLLALAGARGPTAALMLSGSVFVSYAVYTDYLTNGTWSESPVVLGLVWIPVLLALIRDGWHARRS